MLILLQASEKACKKYREWLAAIVETANSLLGAQKQITHAEAGMKQCQSDLTLYVKVIRIFVAVHSYIHRF